MPAEQLYINIIQPDIVWEHKEENLQQYENYINSIREKREVVILPEMFSTGFSMNPEKLAETMEGPSVKWMSAMAVKYRCIVTGSLIIEENDHYYNRLIWMQPDGNMGVYDKRHLFGFAGEDRYYQSGNKRLIARVKGWRLNLMICYDLRFPVWARQSPRKDNGNDEPEYDVLVYVANWPERRNLAWKTLLQARAIENQSYVIGTNRVGTDGNGIYYSGDSSVFNALGEPLWQKSHETGVHTIALQYQELQKARKDLPFLKDADRFLIL